MKVYIVTKGAYSDYQIVKVFLEYAKAEKYIELNKNNSLYDWDVEEYDTYDDNFLM